MGGEWWEVSRQLLWETDTSGELQGEVSKGTMCGPAFSQTLCGSRLHSDGKVWPQGYFDIVSIEHFNKNYIK